MKTMFKDIVFLRIWNKPVMCKGRETQIPKKRPIKKEDTVDRYRFFF
ncbi:MAG: hypothetical protein JJU16_11590 [Alkalibacterium sp.]|nr:hypothetical protein [Alkalibacterium sp.]